MAKRPNLTDITNVLNSASVHNANNDEIDTAFDNTLSRDGSTPNQMEADLDLNSNDILNARDVSVSRNLTVQGVNILDTLQGDTGPATIFNTTNVFSGTGIQTVFTLTKAPVAKENTYVYIHGVYQAKSQYNISTNSITFDTAPPVGSANIEVTIQEATDTSTITPNDVVGLFFNTRAELVSFAGAGHSLDEDTVVWADGLGYVVKAGATSLPNLSGFEPEGAPTLEHFGAIGDGVVDDVLAFDAAEAEGVSPVRLSKTYLASTQHTTHDVQYELDSDATVTLGAGSWNPRRYRKDGVTPFDRKVNFLADNPTVPVEFYVELTDSYQDDKFWINQWGFQERDTDGKLSGSTTPGKIPGGQSRMARTASYLANWNGSHSGEGDAYLQFGSMLATPHAAVGIINAWGGQNSSGIMGFQVNAAGAQVNLYGVGDQVLDDKGFSSVSMLGNVSFLKHTGSNGSYDVPRFNYLALSSGANDADAAYIASGNYLLGMDLSQGSYSSDFALTLASGQRIGFDATAPGDGKFSTQAPGAYWIEKAGSFLAFVVANQASLNLYNDRMEVRPSAQSTLTHRVYGSSSTAFGSLGQFNTITYLSAATTSGAEATQLILQAANSSGVETEALRIVGANGQIRVVIPTYADDAAAGVGGLAATALYQTVTGEVRIKT